MKYKTSYQVWQRHSFFQSPAWTRIFAQVMGSLARPIYQWAGDYVREDWHSANTVADIGCGNAIFIRHLATSNASGRKQIHLMDQSAHQLRAGEHNVRAIARRHEVQTHTGTAEKIPLPSQTFDLVLSTGSINLWSPPRTGLLECVRILRPGGHLWIFDQRPCKDMPDVAAALFRQRVFGLGLPGYTSDEILNFATGLPLTLNKTVEDRSLYGIRWTRTDQSA